MDRQENIAGRILRLVERVCSFPQKVQLEIAWGYTLGVRSGAGEKSTGAHDMLTFIERAETLKRLGRLIEQLDVLEEQVRALPNKTRSERLLPHLFKLREFLSLANLSTPVGDIKKPDDSVILALTFAQDDFPAEHVIPQATLDSYRKRINALFTAVSRDDNIHPDFRKWMLHILSDVNQKLDLYFIYGGEMFRDIYARLCGELGTRSDIPDYENEEGEFTDEDKARRPYLVELYQLTAFSAFLMAKAAPFLVTTIKLIHVVQVALGTPTSDATALLTHTTGPLLDALEKLTDK